MAWREPPPSPTGFPPTPGGGFPLLAVFPPLWAKKSPAPPAAGPRLLSEAGVALVPGDAFGAPDCIRFSYAVADDVLMDALARVRKVLIGQ